MQITWIMRLYEKSKKLTAKAQRGNAKGAKITILASLAKNLCALAVKNPETPKPETPKPAKPSKPAKPQSPTACPTSSTAP